MKDNIEEFAERDDEGPRGCLRLPVVLGDYGKSFNRRSAAKKIVGTSRSGPHPQKTNSGSRK